MTLTQADQTHFAEILALNEESVHFLSPLSAQRLEQLHQQAAYHKLVLEGGRVAAFLLAFAPGSSYDSINYQWFEARLARFLYIDRVVVSPDFRGRGLASRLYQDLFDHARECGMSQVVCEFDIDPPNPASEAFHRRFGFSQLGTQAVASKWVSLQGAPVVPAASP
jgi:predicted GNAT superfamily acetyltransferase